jgi:predicted nucleic acid-binding protein
VIVVDTSVLIDALTGNKHSARSLNEALERGERLGLLTLVLYEWLRGPRVPVELEAQEFLFPAASALSFEADDARVAAKLYRSARRARGRDVDIAIAACTIRRQAELWTLNRADFSDVPGLKLYARSNFS